MVLQYRNFTMFCKMQEPMANLDSFDFLSSDQGQGLLNRWTSQLDLGCMTGGLERVVSVHT